MNNLNRRDQFVIAAMRSILVRRDLTINNHQDTIIKFAVEYADKIIAELDKDKCHHKNYFPCGAGTMTWDECKDCGIRF